MKRITLKHVSEAAGVSIQTVSQVLSPQYCERFRADTREKVVRAAKTLGYRPNAAARAMLKKQSHIVGVLVPIVHGGWFFQLDVFETMLGMNERLTREGYVTTIIPVWELQRGGQLSRAFHEQLLDGVVVIGWAPQDVCKFIADVAPVCIWCDTNMDKPKGCIRRDELHAGRLATGELAKLGYRRLVWVTYASSGGHYSSRDRLTGVRQVADQCGLPIEIVGCTTPSLAAEAQALLPMLRPDTAVLTEHMHFAQSVANLTQQAGLIAGRDYGLAACDHSGERAGIFPAISRVVIERIEVGAKAAEMVLESLAGETLPDSTVFHGRWHSGTTTRQIT